MSTTPPKRIQVRAGTTAQWTAANPVLGKGEPGFDTDTRQLKVGDGTSPWLAIPVTTSFDPFDVPVSIRDWAKDGARQWFGPAGGQAIYCSDPLPAGSVAGMSWDDPDTTIGYDIRPVAFADTTHIVLRRTALRAA